MSKQEPPPNDKLRPHVYDGIQEFDNRLPNWWLWTFYGAIIISVLYWFSWYNADMMEDDMAVLEAQMAKVEEARLAAAGEISNETLWQMSRNPGFVDAGREIYREKCLACHGPDLNAGAGLAGVSLVDTEWKWGNQPVSIYAVVADGSPDRMAGMDRRARPAQGQPGGRLPAELPYRTGAGRGGHPQHPARVVTAGSRRAIHRP